LHGIVMTQLTVKNKVHHLAAIPASRIKVLCTPIISSV
jgi:hypothetical protein